MKLTFVRDHNATVEPAKDQVAGNTPNRYSISVTLDKNRVPGNPATREQVADVVEGALAKYTHITQQMMQACSIVPEFLVIELKYDLAKSLGCDQDDLDVSVQEEALYRRGMWRYSA